MSNSIASDMKNDINTATDIKIKLISNGFFNMDNLWSLSNYLNPTIAKLSVVDIGIDRIIKFETFIPTYDIIKNYEIVQVMRCLINDDRNRISLRSILTEEELQFLDFHFEMLYTIESFPNTNAIYVRI